MINIDNLKKLLFSIKIFNMEESPTHSVQKYNVIKIDCLI